MQDKFGDSEPKKYGSYQIIKEDDKLDQNESNEELEDDSNDIIENKRFNTENEPPSSKKAYTVSYRKKTTTHEPREAEEIKIAKTPVYYKESVSLHPDGYAPTKLMPRDSKYLPQSEKITKIVNTTAAPSTSTFKYQYNPVKINETYLKYAEAKKESKGYDTKKELEAKKEYLESLLDTLREMVKAQKVLENVEQRNYEKQTKYAKKPTSTTPRPPTTRSASTTSTIAPSYSINNQHIVPINGHGSYSREYNSVQHEKLIPYETSTHTQNLETPSQAIENVRHNVYSDERDLDKDLDEYGYPFTKEIIRAKIEQALLDYDQRYHRSAIKCPGCKRNRNYHAHRDVLDSKVHSIQSDASPSEELAH
jgi:hypothetical protein